MRVSLITLNWEHWEDLTEPWMQTVKEHVPGGVELELVVVDQGSTNGDTIKLAKAVKRNADLNVLLLPSNVGFPAGCNRGFEASTGDITIWINNDIEFYGDWLTPVLAPLRLSKTTIVGASMIREGGWNEFDINGEKLRIPYLEGWLLAFWPQAYLDIGPFDEAFGTGSLEDVDWCHRATKAGYRLCAVDDLEAKGLLYHKRGSTVTDGRLETNDISQSNYHYLQAKLIQESVVVDATTKLESGVTEDGGSEEAND